MSKSIEMKSKRHKLKVVLPAFAVTVAMLVGGCGSGSSSGGLQMATDGVHSMSYSTDEGRYEISETANQLKDGTTLTSLTYVDYAAGKQVYLCNKPNCNHDSYSCSAVLPEETLGNSNYLMGDGEYLYILSSPVDDAGSTMTGWVNPEYGSMLDTSSGSTAAPVVYRMKTDGSAREKLYSFDEGQVVEDHVLRDGNDWYFVTKKLKTEDINDNTQYTSGYDRKLVKVNLNNGKQKEIADLDSDTEILGAGDGKIILGKTKYAKDYTPAELNNDATFKKALKDSTYILSALDVKSGKTTKIISFKQDKESSQLVSDGKVYMSFEDSNIIDIYDIASEKTEKFKCDGGYYLEKIIDGKLIAVPWTTDNEYSSYFIDTETGKVTECGLHTRHNNPIDIISTMPDRLFVYYDYEEGEEYVPWMDLNQTVNTRTYFGTISKEDYFAGKANYSEVKMLEEK